MRALSQDAFIISDIDRIPVMTAAALVHGIACVEVEVQDFVISSIVKPLDVFLLQQSAVYI